MGSTSPIATEKVAFERLVKKFAGGGLSIAVEAGNQTAWVHEELVKLPRVQDLGTFRI